MDQREPKGSSKGAQEEPKTPKRDQVGGSRGAKSGKVDFSKSFKKPMVFIAFLRIWGSKLVLRSSKLRLCWGQDGPNEIEVASYWAKLGL